VLYTIFTMTRYILVGAGAIGSALGGCLTMAGASAVLVGRAGHVAAVSADGLRLRGPGLDERVRLPACTGPEGVRLTVEDVLVLTTKTQQAAEALFEWADVPVHDGDRVVGSAWELLPMCTALNGVSSEAMALRWFRRVYAVCVWMPATFLRPGEVVVRCAPTRGVFHVGTAHTSRDESSARLDDTLFDSLRTEWGAARCRVVATDQVMAWKYRKLVSNAMNSVRALVEDRGDLERLTLAVERETRAVLDAAGIDYIGDEEERAARADVRLGVVPGEPASLWGSTWQSLERGGGQTESDYLNGEIARLARLHGVAAPLNERLAYLVRRAAAERQAPGGMSSDQLTAALKVLALPSTLIAVYRIPVPGL
jgi:2-dehydropantoate 2-reductase